MTTEARIEAVVKFPFTSARARFLVDGESRNVESGSSARVSATPGAWPNPQPLRFFHSCPNARGAAKPPEACAVQRRSACC